MEKPINITVVGSMNMDLTVTTLQMPEKGETVLGKEFATYPGGKGANQAVAAARLGATVHMIGAVGDDSFGKELLVKLQKEGIHTDAIEVKNDMSTGTATIILSEQDNRIIVAPGANAAVTPEIVEKQRKIIECSDIILVQLEIPMETVQYVTNLASDLNIPVIMNPAPYQDLPAQVLESATYITPNEVEALALFESVNNDSIQDKLIITKGSHGTCYYDNGNEVLIPAYKVNVQDTTGAGDTFNGALAVRLGGGASKEEAVSFANAAAALSITKVGAQSGMPTRKQVMEFIAD
ncbi:ribokinase [Paucisalibacillus globulus]|uniref:ribokinase n=1 Tax=Paucisalibacillus globulus TaxID=351095 RepID=UPI00040C2A2B|nr:ribokinase [Paucisalibacillus globulus]